MSALHEFRLDAKRIDWSELRDQKQWLITKAHDGTPQAEGLLNFLDWIQDEAVDQGAAPEAEVFLAYQL